MSQTEVLKKREIESLMKELERGEHIKKEASISWDGSNFLVRIPKEIADYLEITKNNRSSKKIRFFIHEVDGEIKKEFEIVNKDGN
jgi:hypothetical protein